MSFRFTLAAVAAACLLASGASAQIVYDGQITEADWYLVDNDDGGTTTDGFGTDGKLNALYADVADDGSSLSLAIAGIEGVTSNNYILVFLDTKEGGVTSGGYDRTDAPAGVNAFHSGDTFDAGFEPDYVLQINCISGPNRCFFDLYTLTSSGTGSNNFLGEEQDNAVNSNDLGVDLPVGDEDRETRGFELRLDVGSDIDLDRQAFQAFAMITAGNGFYSNQFIAPAGPSQGNYGGGTVDFNNEPADPVAYVEFTFAGRDGNNAGQDRGAWTLGAPARDLTVQDLADQDYVFPDCSGCPIPEIRNVFIDYDTDITAPLERYDLADDITTPLVPGEVFTWYLLDGRRGSQTLPWTLSLGGPMNTGTVARTHDVNSDDFYFIGNPFHQPVDPTAFTITDGTLDDAFYVYQSWGGYDNRSTLDGDVLLEMEGAFFGIVETGTPATVGWSIPQSARTTASLLVTKDGQSTRAELRLLAERDGAYAPAAEVALTLAPEAASRAPRLAPDGTPLATRMTLATDRAAGLGQASVPASGARFALDVEAEPGRYALALDGDLAGRIVRVLDRATAETVTLASGDTYAFEGAVDGRFALEVLAEGETAAPVQAVGGVHPNPASGDAHVMVDAQGTVRVEVLDLLGRRVALAFEGTVEGPRAVALDAASLAPGAYLVRVTGEGVAETRRLTVAR